jgi:predicted nucleic acid-binding Zn ribbon protein
MPIYVYETVPTTAGEAPERFEVRQSMSEAPLTAHPDHGAPVRRVLSGGLVTFTNSASSDRCGAPASGLPTMGCGASQCCMMQ